MKRKYLIIVMAGIVVLSAGLAVSGGASVEMGKKLFNDSSLGGSANQSSCASCHPNGRGLENAGQKENLVKMINTCIERPLKGEALADQSQEMQSLQLYIKSLEK